MQELKIRPYARLLSMLGDQLIKNETIALTELVKNSYDADASVCEVKFLNFDDKSSSNLLDSYIIIEDDGFGMSYETITKHFLNPATPVKKTIANEKPRKTEKGRIMQGEKGIGRFSMLKLGKVVTIYSKQPNSSVVHKILFDFAKYDDEFLTDTTLFSNQDIYLDDIVIEYESLDISDFNTELFSIKGQGTTIRIDNLKGQWNLLKIKDFEKGLLRFNPFELESDSVVVNKDFTIDTFINNVKREYKEKAIFDLKDIIFHKSIYKITGKYNEEKSKIIFKYSESGNAEKEVEIYLEPGISEELDVNNLPSRATKDFQGLTIYRKDNKGRTRIFDFFENGRKTECGNFEFNFYIFDFNAKPKEPLGMQKEEKDIIREHRVFLYRDDVRVQPYGAPDDDWLQIDRHRAEIRANEQFSNDQIFGQIKITKEGNEKLKDKTSREGIIEDSQAFEQLTLLVRGMLSYVRTKLYQNYNNKKRKQAEKEEISEMLLEKEFSKLKYELTDNNTALKRVESLQQAVQKRESIYTRRLDIAEQLAGVGLSVEAASHDIMLLIDRLKDNIRQTNVESTPSIVPDIDALSYVHKKTEEAEGMIGLIYMKMKDLQQLFVSSKQRPKLIDVKDVIEKIKSIYAKSYKDRNIKVDFDQKGSPVKAKTIDAVLYQVFINLFDNALYWVQETTKERLVKITFDGDNQRVIFSDNGIGINPDDVPYIFDAFYTGKGEDGRGLGLYIARKLLEKSKYSIDVITNERDKILPGANFVIYFVTQEDE